MSLVALLLRWFCEVILTNYYSISILTQYRQTGLCKRKQPLLATWTTGEDKYMNLALNLALSVRRNAPHLERTDHLERDCVVTA